MTSNLGRAETEATPWSAAPRHPNAAAASGTPALSQLSTLNGSHPKAAPGRRTPRSGLFR